MATRLAVAFVLAAASFVFAQDAAPPVDTPDHPVEGKAKTVIGEVTMPLDGNLSVAVYEPGGQIVRTLFEAVPQSKGAVVKLVWDGKDDVGNPAPRGNYEWRSIASQAKGVDDGWIGDMGNPPYGFLSEHGADVRAVAADAEGNIYETSNWEEAHEELRVWSPDGTGLRYRTAAGGRTVTVDDEYVYQVFAVDWKDELAAVRRFTRDKLKLRNWIGTLRGTVEISGGVVALAAGKDALWVCGHNSAEVHDKTTGELRRIIPLSAPRAVAIDGNGHGWIAHSGDRVTEFDADGVKSREITGLNNPGALSFGGPQQHLYIGEITTGRVLEYDCAAMMQVRALFSAAKPGPVSDTALLWPLVGSASLTVDAQGRITVADPGNHRVMTYAPDGSVLRQRYSEMQMAPMVDPAVNPDTVLSQNMEYEVNYQRGPDYGKWKVLNNWYGCGTSTLRRKIGDRQYLFSLGGKKNSVFDLTDGALRPCALINSYEGGLWIWTDTNGDGRQQDSEVVKTAGAGNANYLGPGVWVDQAGNLWIANWNGETVMLPIDGIDTKGNPIYDWSHKKTVIVRDASKWKVNPANLRIDPANGDIYRVGSSAYCTLTNPSQWMGGGVVERYSNDGKRISAFPMVGGHVAVVIATDTDGKFFYTGHSHRGQSWVCMYTNDGLLVTTARMGGPSGPSGGWMDHGLALSAFTHPKTGVHYAYAEEVFWGKAIRYRIDNLESLVRPGQGKFEWTAGQ